MGTSRATAAHLKARQSVTMSARCASVSCSAAATPRHIAGPSLPSATRTFSTTAVATNFFTLLMLVSAALYSHASLSKRCIVCCAGTAKETQGSRGGRLALAVNQRLPDAASDNFQPAALAAPSCTHEREHRDCETAARA